MVLDLGLGGGEDGWGVRCGGGGSGFGGGGKDLLYIYISKQLNGWERITVNLASSQIYSCS